MVCDIFQFYSAAATKAAAVRWSGETGYSTREIWQAGSVRGEIREEKTIKNYKKLKILR